MNMNVCIYLGEFYFYGTYVYSYKKLHLMELLGTDWATLNFGIKFTTIAKFKRYVHTYVP